MSLRISRWIRVVLVGVVITTMGCEGCKDRIKSLVYEEVDRSETPVSQSAVKDLGESEPNDRREDARRIVVKRDMDPLRGEISSSSDVDWFALDRDGEDEWIVELAITPEDEDFDPAIYLDVSEVGDEAVPLLYDVAKAGEPEVVPMLRVPAEGVRRFFVAGAGGTTGGYRVQVRRRLSAGTVTVEPDDHPELAATLEIPGEVQGFYDRPGDRDIFFVPGELLRAGVYSLELSHLPEMPQKLRVYGDKSLETVLLAIDVGADRPAVVPNISLAAGEGEGLYFVLSAGDAYDRDRSYRLRVLEHPPGDGYVVEREPNDRAETAQIVGFGDRVRGYFHTESDVDRFRFVIEPPAEEEGLDGIDEVEEVEEVEEVDGLLEEEAPQIIDPWEGVPEKERPEFIVQTRLTPLSEMHILAMRWLPDVESGEQEIGLEADDEEQHLVLCNHVLGPGAYDVEVRALQSLEGFRARNFDYEIEFLNIAEEDSLEVEPNNTRADADRLKRGEARVGYISYPGDVDVFAFVVGPDEPYEVDRLGLSEERDQHEVALAGPVAAPTLLESVRVNLKGNSLNLNFEILDDEGGRVARVDQGGPGADEDLTIDLPTGLYYLAVRASSGSICEPYSVEISTP